MFHSPLKRFALSKLGKVAVRFPYYDYGDFTDPERINAIFPQHEWTVEKPSSDLSERRDWQHIFAVDSTSGDRIEIFFERLPGGTAVAWARLNINGDELILPEAWYKDYSDVSTNVYSAGGIRLECTGPLRYWRIAINALFLTDKDLEKANRDQCNEVHVRVGARVAMMSHPFEIPQQCSASMLVQRFRNEYGSDTTKIKDSITKCCSGLEAFLQGIALYSEITLNGDRKEYLMHGCRIKFVGKSDLLQNIRHFTGYANNGTVFHLMEVSSGKIKGYCFHPSFFDKPISRGRIELNQAAGDKSFFTLTFDTSTTGATFSHTLSFETRCEVAVNLKTGGHWSVREMQGELTRDNHRDKSRLYGVSFQLPRKYKPPSDKLQMYSLLGASSDIRLDAKVISTSEETCRAPSLAGGKGSSLAVLTAIANFLNGNSNRQTRTAAFTVPPAVVMTINAYQVFANLSEVKTAIEELQASIRYDVAGEEELSTIKAATERCVATLNQVALSSSLAEALALKMAEVFGVEWGSWRFAVRSSAVGEDSEEMSAAGQMTTYLGVVGQRHIYEAIVKCWSSQFALRAVHYKRQYGQSLDGPMAVVIQEMAPAQCAGVMFTCDPVSSRPARVILTANFGLGESVVSAMTDPDTYTLQWAPGNLEATTTNSDAPVVTLLSKVCGAKDRMVVESVGMGTQEKILGTDDSQNFCLSDEQAILLTTIGLKVTEFTNTPRDIEWALVDGKVVLLQSRPVTSVFRESDFEIQNDLNSALYTHREILSRANLDEVMPGVISPMSLSLVNQVVMETFSKEHMERVLPNLFDRSPYTYTHAFNIGRRIYMDFSGNIFGDKRSLEAAQANMIGYDVTDHDAFKDGIFHDKKRTSRDNIDPVKFMLNATRNLEPTAKCAREQAERIQIDVSQESDSLSMLLSLLRQMHKIKGCLKLHIMASSPLMLLNVLALHILKKSQQQEKSTPEMMVIMSKLLRSDYDVESALIAKELSDLATSMRNDTTLANFAEMSIEEAKEWLQDDECEVAKAFRSLRTKHAHRCYKEFDIYTKTWDIDPTLLIRTLQANVRAGDVKKKTDEKMTIDDLQQRPSFVQRKLLKYLISRTQLAVYSREATKSALIRCLHHVRLAVRCLGQQLQVEGQLPDADLVFFFTIDELYRLITTRNPSLLQRAIRRSKMHRRLDKQKFPVLFCGIPTPIESNTVPIPHGSRHISGTPVSEGVVVGTARIVQDFLSEAHLIQKGDILVTRATDTDADLATMCGYVRMATSHRLCSDGWTPYFSLVSGVVTEIGGLLSHGAVVAREYGLPAVVGAVGATSFFESGEIITLDGNNGIVSKQDQDIPTSKDPSHTT